jgi:NAD+ synthetase
MKLALAQINTTIGAIDHNLMKMRRSVEQAMEQSAELVVFPELAVTGYPPRDLLDRPEFIRQAWDKLANWTANLPGGHPDILLGAPVVRPAARGRGLWNAAVCVQNHQVTTIHPKTLLPTYDVFDEDRWFEPLHRAPELAEIGPSKVGVTICEDIWLDNPAQEGHRYRTDPVQAVVLAGAEFIVNLSASPYAIGKHQTRIHLLRELSTRHQRPIIYLNAVGGNDELIFDGRSLVFDAEGNIRLLGPAFEEALLCVDLDTLDNMPLIAPPGEEPEHLVADALTAGIRDYFSKVGLEKAIIGLSGGIDSAVTAALAVNALGPDRVVGLAMPSEFSSEHSVTDAVALAENLGIQCHIVPIQKQLATLRQSLEPLLGPPPWGVTDENLQARIRGQILMAWSNRYGHLVLSTGNKSELAVGYCTLYGDMCGGLAVLSDLPKTNVYTVANVLNAQHVVIPQSTIDKPPSAELRPDQRDDQSLPDYEILDPILELYIEQRLEPAEIAARGYDLATAQRIAALVDRAEYKRRQMPIGLRVTGKAFGSGRRIPIAQQWTTQREQ